MTNLVQISIPFTTFNNFHAHLCKKQSCLALKLSQPIGCYYLNGRKIDGFRVIGSRNKCFWEVGRGKGGILVKGEGYNGKKRVVLVKGFGFNGGGSGGDRDDDNTARILGNIALAVGLTYLSLSGQLGWILDAIVSIWLLAVILPVIGLGAFIWWIGRDMVQGTCPNCGNGFQIFKSSMKDSVQLCPYCTQPFSVDGNEFVKEPANFTNRPTSFGQEYSDFPTRVNKGKKSSGAVVDVEAEIKDAD